MASPIEEKKTKGQQKIVLKKMTNEKRLSVTFSKRRSGLFKKADALCSVCGAEAALIVFSPGGRPVTFGHPNVDAVLDKYLSMLPPPDRVSELNGELRETMEQVEAEEKRAEELKRKRKEMEEKHWWAAPFDTLSRPHQEKVKARLEQLHKDLTHQVDAVLLPSASNANPPHDFYAYGSSVAPPAQNPVFDGSMMLPPPHDDFHACGSLVALPAQNPVLEGNMPPHDFYECGSLVPPPAQNQMFDENMMLPPPYDR